MTVCGIKHADGVCVMGKCPYVKKCCPAVWDKSGKVEMTNDEWRRTCSTEEFAIWIERIMFIVRYRKEVEDGAYMQMMTKKDYIENWLKEKHEK